MRLSCFFLQDLVAISQWFWFSSCDKESCHAKAVLRCGYSTEPFLVHVASNLHVPHRSTLCVVFFEKLIKFTLTASHLHDPFARTHRDFVRVEARAARS